MNISSSNLRRLKAIRPRLPIMLGKDGEWLADLLGVLIERSGGPRFSPKASEKAQRNELLREHDRGFNSPSDSLTCRAKAIERDLERASSGRRIVDLRIVSAQGILKQNSGKCLRYRHIMKIIQ